MAILAIALLAVGLSYKRKAPESHREARQLVLYYTFSRVEQPIVILGDSITEASSLPRTICGHPVVNAGLNGASTASDLGTWLIDTLDGKRASAILIALGTNDVLLGHDAQVFETNYAALLAQLAKATDHLAVLAIPPIEVRRNVTPDFQATTMRKIDAFNALLPAFAAKASAAFAILPAMPAAFTIDGVHLSAAGYTVWDTAVQSGVSGACSTK